MSTPRAGVGQHAILLPNGKVLVTGGTATSPFAELYDPSTGQWSSANAPACVSVCRLEASATLLNTGNVLVAGGFVGKYPNQVTTASALLYAPSTNSWTTTGSLNVSRARDTASLLPNGQVLVAGGENESNDRFTTLTSAELYTP
jgi:N-acetylneuraminic acid mutarotase